MTEIKATNYDLYGFTASFLRATAVNETVLILPSAVGNADCSAINCGGERSITAGFVQRTRHESQNATVAGTVDSNRPLKG